MFAPSYSSKDRAALAIVDAAVAASARASARGARAAVRNLEEVTLNQTDNQFLPGRFDGDDVWNVTRTQFGCGVIELRATRGNWLKCKRVKSSVALESTKLLPATPSETESIGERFESSVKRSRRLLRERCLQLNANNLLTLTKRGKFHSLENLWGTFKEFSRLMSLRFGSRWKYVAVPELHEDGETYHMHLAMQGFFSVESVRIVWYRALGGKGDERGEHTPGSVNFAKRRYGAGPAKARKLAGYVSKYVGKGFVSCSRNRRLFATSRGLAPDHVTRWHCRYWTNAREFCIAAQQWLHQLGGNAQGDAFFWSRHRGDESLLMTGFVLSTVGVIENA